MKKINSAHSVFKLFGGAVAQMIEGVPPSFPKSKPKTFAGCAVKRTRNYRKRYSHVLSDYVAQKNLEGIQKRKNK